MQSVREPPDPPGIAFPTRATSGENTVTPKANKTGKSQELGAWNRGGQRERSTGEMEGQSHSYPRKMPRMDNSSPTRSRRGSLLSRYGREEDDDEMETGTRTRKVSSGSFLFTLAGKGETDAQIAAKHMRRAQTVLAAIGGAELKDKETKEISEIFTALKKTIEGLVKQTRPTQARPDDEGVIKMLAETVKQQQECIAEQLRQIKNLTNQLFKSKGGQTTTDAKGEQPPPTTQPPPNTTQGKPKEPKKTATEATRLIPSEAPIPIVPTRPANGTGNRNSSPSKNQSPPNRHSDLRLTLKCKPSLSRDDQLPALQIRDLVNAALEKAGKSVRIKAGEYTNGGHINLYAMEPSTSEDLLKEVAIIKTQLLPEGTSCVAHRDAQWHKVQVAAVPTGLQHGQVITDPEEIWREIRYCNDEHIKREQLVEPPRYLATPEAVSRKERASIVLTFGKEEDASSFMKLGFIFYMGVKCYIKRFEDRKPFRQCQRCFSYEHASRDCRSRERCRLCKGNHLTPNHKCLHDGCGKTSECDHNNCVNCGGDHPADFRLCPTKIMKVGLSADSRLAKTSSSQKGKGKNQTVQEWWKGEEGQKTLSEVTRQYPELSPIQIWRALSDAKGEKTTALPQLEQEANKVRQPPNPHRLGEMIDEALRTNENDTMPIDHNE